MSKHLDESSGSTRVLGGPYRDALGLQDEAGHVPGGQAQADGAADPLHQVGPEGVAGSHLQEEDHPLLPVLVVLGDTQAVQDLLEGLHCGDRARASLSHHPTLMGTAVAPLAPPARAPGNRQDAHPQQSQRAVARTGRADVLQGAGHPPYLLNYKFKNKKRNQVPRRGSSTGGRKKGWNHMDQDPTLITQP